MSARALKPGAWLSLLAAWAGLAADPGSTEVGGAVTADATWSPAMGEIRVMSDVAVLAGVTLRVEPGTVIRLAAGRSLRATNAVVQLRGTWASPVSVGPAEAGGTWGTLGVHGAAGVLEIVHAELRAGRVEVTAGAGALLEDSELHDLASGPIVRTLRPGSFVMRRCHVHDYYEILCQLAVSVIEDCHLHDIGGDGIDFDGALAGSVIRRCTVAEGRAVNVDAIDLGSYGDGTASSNVVVESCRVYGFPYDKGVSIGEAASGVVVRDCVLYGLNSGVAVKDSARAEVYNNTIAGAVHGLHVFEKVAGQGGGRVAAWNNILWGNTNAFTVDIHSDLDATFCDVQGGAAGEGNLDVDPGFLDAATADYRLAEDSPVRGLGRDGDPLGARPPTGSSLVDTDSDGLPDPWEEEQGLNPRAAEDAGLDPDGDGRSSWEEFECGTDPRDGESVLRLEVSVSAVDEVTLEFHGVASRLYRLEVAGATGAGWERLEPPVVGADRRMALTVGAGGALAGFYRLVVERER